MSIKINVELERVLTLAENSESSDAILLAAEVRRLRKIEAGLIGHIERHTKLAKTLGAEAAMWRNNGNYRAAENLTHDADGIMFRVRRLQTILD